MDEVLVQSLVSALNQHHESGRKLRFWLRDDDAVEPGESLDRLLTLTQLHAIPLTLAVIPALTDQALAQRLAAVEHVHVAVHGWSHTNHAPQNEKKQELGLHRPIEEIFAELSRGYSLLANLHGPRFIPLLVPPWNRISPVVVQGLPELGYRGLSTFGEAGDAAVTIVNTRIDLIDWKGTRGGREHNLLLAEIIQHIQDTSGPIGLLTHHLVHDDNAWQFLEEIFAMTAGQAGCEWVSVSDILADS